MATGAGCPLPPAHPAQPCPARPWPPRQVGRFETSAPIAWPSVCVYVPLRPTPTPVQAVPSRRIARREGAGAAGAGAQG